VINDQMRLTLLKKARQAGMTENIRKAIRAHMVRVKIRVAKWELHKRKNVRYWKSLKRAKSVTARPARR
jgi:hypothetical protein